MYAMCEAIGQKLGRATPQINVQQVNLGEGENLPQASQVRYDEVWLCGHSRFVEANGSIRKISARHLGGFPIEDVAKFVKDCVTRGREKIRLICCESAQQQRYKPTDVGQPPDGLSGVLGHELLQTLNNRRFLDLFDSGIDAKASHLEGLIVAIANLWREEKNADQPAFEICGLWGAGDITDDNEPITSFLQDGGSLEAQKKMNDSGVKDLARKKFASTFENAHCNNKGLPDFFGFRITRNFLVQWVPKKKG
jgi:hypothetical protein